MTKWHSYRGSVLGNRSAFFIRNLVGYNTRTAHAKYTPLKEEELVELGNKS